MATLSKKRKYNWEIQYDDLYGRRRTITLSKAKFSENIAVQFKNVLETLLFKARNSDDTLDKRTSGWIESALPEIQEKLRMTGLVKLPEPISLDELWDQFLCWKTKEGKIKPATMELYERTRDRFRRCFKGTEILRELTQEQMQSWKESLRKTLSEATVAGAITKAQAVFRWAIKNNWLTISPLDGVPRGSFVNKDKDRHIPMKDYYALLDVCPCHDWQTIIALARVGGLRSPSEILRLRWSDINWAKNRFYVTSPKTAHHNGKDHRWVPLFKELRRVLAEHFFLSESEGAEFVVKRYRDPERSNLGTQFGRIVRMAGLEPIPKPFCNMRASRSTEIYAEEGAFLESCWIGHSTKTAMKHYLQVRDEDFDRAAGIDITSSPKNSSDSPRNVDNANDDCSVLLDSISGFTVPPETFTGQTTVESGDSEP